MLQLSETELKTIIHDNYQRIANQIRTYGKTYRPGSQKAREWEYHRSIEIATLALNSLKSPEFSIKIDPSQWTEELTDTVERFAENRTLLEYYADNVNEIPTMNRYEFEQLVADIFAAFGYIVEETAPSRDGGFDVIAFTAEGAPIRSKYLIECKRPDPGNKVGVAAVRALLGVRHENKASQALIVTSATFTKGATDLMQKNAYEIAGIDFDGLSKLITRWKQRQ